MSTSNWLHQALEENKLAIARWPQWKREMAGLPEPNWSEYDICPCCGTVLGLKEPKP